MVKNVKDILLDDFWIMPATPEYIEQGVPYITSKNIKNGKIDFSKANYISQDAYETISKNRPILVGDILISMIGTLGETAEVTVEDGNFYGQNMFLIRLNETEVNKRYFLNYFKSDFVKRSLASKQNQSTQKYLKANHIEDLQIPVLSLKEQQSIAETLDTIERIIINRKEELLKLDELIKGRFIELFGDGHDGKSPTKMLGSICKFQQGTQIPVEEQFEEQISGYKRFLRIIDYTQAPQPPRYVNVNGKEVDEKSVVIVRYGATAGFVGRGHQGILANNLFEIMPDETILSKDFLFLALKYGTFEEEVHAKAFGAAMPALSFSMMNDIPVVVPATEQQQQFVSFVEQTDKSKFIDTMIKLIHIEREKYEYKKNSFKIIYKKNKKRFDFKWNC